MGALIYIQVRTSWGRFSVSCSLLATLLELRLLSIGQVTMKSSSVLAALAAALPLTLAQAGADEDCEVAYVSKLSLDDRDHHQLRH